MKYAIKFLHIEFNKISAYVPKANKYKGLQVPGKCLRRA